MSDTSPGAVCAELPSCNADAHSVRCPLGVTTMSLQQILARAVTDTNPQIYGGTNTRTHTLVKFANPYLVCDKCKKLVSSYHDPEKCGCATVMWNEPCEDPSGVTSLCPSWSPVDGCLCQEHLGYTPHRIVPKKEKS